MAGFLGHPRMEDDLELEIAELVCERVHVVAGDCVGDFIRFLDRVGRDGRKGLDAVPFAAADGIAQPPHDRDEPIKARGLRGASFRLHISKYDNMHYVNTL